MYKSKSSPYHGAYGGGGGNGGITYTNLYKLTELGHIVCTNVCS